MKDNISKGQGNSRYLKSVANFKALYPTYDDFVDALVAGTLPVDFNGKNNAGWQQIGTELSTANLMSGQTASLFNLTSDNVPDDIFDLIGRGLPIRNGGTGATTASSAFYNIVSALSTVSSASSSYYIPMQYSSSGRRISYTNLSNAIKNSVSSSLTPQDIGAATVEVGSYVGSGRNNSDDGDKGTVSNPMSITFSSAPKIVFIRDSHWTFYNQYSGVMETFPPIILMNSLSTSEFLPNTSDPDIPSSYYQMVRFKKSSNGRTLYYYGDNSYGGAAIWAFNLQGRTYWYAGIL